MEENLQSKHGQNQGSRSNLPWAEANYSLTIIQPIRFSEYRQILEVMWGHGILLSGKLPALGSVDMVLDQFFSWSILVVRGAKFGQ